jgi:RNA polymerase sigma-70 factor (ECF subfamily)
MPEDPADTSDLLQRWRAGDQAALDALLARDLPWIRERVHRRLGNELRRREETEDFVQDVVLEFLRYGPRIVLSSRPQLLALLARIVENVIRGKHDRFTAFKRAVAKERPLAPDSVLSLEGPASPPQGPRTAAERAEWEGFVRLGLELLDPEDREVILLRQWEGLGFAETGRRLDIAEDAARMRFHRALARLGAAIHDLKSGRVGSLVHTNAPEP